LGLTRSQLVEIVTNLCEGSAQKLKIQSWIELELAQLVARKSYWWRRKTLSFNSGVAVPTYDFSQDGLDVANDFLKLIKLWRWNGGGTNKEPIPYISDVSGTVDAVYGTTQAKPTGCVVEPGTTKVLRLTPIPIAAEAYVGLYEAGVNINWDDTGDGIPLLPPEYHFVLSFALNRRVFQYLYGQNDNRYATALAEEKEAIAMLDNYKAPSAEVAFELRSSDPQDFVRSTS
jgi:hypothetical protein